MAKVFFLGREATSRSEFGIIDKKGNDTDSYRND